jgi:signal transduction histidine kinase/ActR/RegA family two-component response regulator
MPTTDFSDNGYTARFLASRESRINRNISRHILPLSLLTAPILWVGTQTGAFSVSNVSLIILFAASAVFTLTAYLLANRRLLDPAVKYIELTAAALLIFFMSIQQNLDLSMAYCIVPLLGCYFLTRNVFNYSLILGYALMILSIFLRSGNTWQYMYRDSPGTFILTAVTGRTVEYAFVAIVLVVMYQAFQDTLLRMQEQAAMRETERIKNETKSTFLASMAHDIRTPVNAISGCGELIARSTREEITRTRAQKIGSACSSLLGIINDILDLSSIESGKISVVNAPFDLSAMLGELKNEAGIDASEKGLELRFLIDPETPGKISADRSALNRVLQNLLSNAIKYTLSGTVTLSLSCRTARNGDTALAASVTDTGIGIKREDLDTLLTDFRRLRDPQTANVSGTGLGLSICCGLLKAMGGELKVESEYGSGSTFYFSIPVDSVTESAPIGSEAGSFADGAAVTGEYTPSFTAPGARIMAVDDNEINADILQALLEDTGMTIDTAYSGEECLKMAGENRYDVILMDHQMPGMDGVQALRELKKPGASLNPDVKVIALTANVFENARGSYLSMGFDDYVPKPFQPEQVEAAVSACLPPELVRRI